MADALQLTQVQRTWRDTDWARVKGWMDLLGITDDVKEFEHPQNGIAAYDSAIEHTEAAIDLLTQFVILHLKTGDLQFTPTTIAPGAQPYGWFQEAAEEFLIAGAIASEEPIAST